MAWTLLSSDATGFLSVTTPGNVYTLPGGAPPAGVVEILFITSATTLTSVSAGGGASWTTQESFVSSSGNYTLWRVTNGSEGTTVNILMNGASNPTSIRFMRFSGQAASPFDRGAASTAGSGTSSPSLSSGALAGTGELVVAFAGMDVTPPATPSAVSWSGAFTDDGNGPAGNADTTGHYSWGAYQANAGAGAVTAQASWTTTQTDTFTQVVAFKPAPPVTAGISRAQPGRTWLRRYHHRQALRQASPAPGPVIATASLAGAGAVTANVTQDAGTATTLAGAGTVTAAVAKTSIAVVQDAAFSGSTTSPVTLTFGSATTAGNLITIQAHAFTGTSAGSGPTAITDSAGTNTWHFSSTNSQNPPTAITANGTDNYSAFVAWTFATASVTTVTFTLPNLSFTGAVATEYAGAASLDTAASYNGAISSAGVALTLTLTSGDLVVIDSDTDTTLTASPPMITWYAPNSGFNLYKSGTQTLEFATAGSDHAALVAAAFKPVADNGPQPYGGIGGAITGGPWQPVFNDDFDTFDTGPVSNIPRRAVWADRLIWGDMVRAAEGSGGAGSDCSWASHNDAGLSVADSVLSIIARFESPYSSGSVGYDPLAPNPTDAGVAATYTSGIATTAPGFAYTYGYVEALISIPVGTPPFPAGLTGIWPAFFTVSRTGEWGPENDIMEFLSGGSSSSLWEQVQPSPPQAYHVNSPFGSPAVDTDYHVWGMRWSPSDVTYFLDGTQYGTYTTSANIPSWNSIVQLVYQVPQATTGGQGSLNFDYVRAWVVQGVPAQPAITSVSPASGIPASGSLTVNFGAVSGATSYRATVFPIDVQAYQQANSGANPGFGQATGSSSPLTVTGLTNGVPYSVSVAAVNGTGYSIESLPVPSLSATASTATLAGAGAVTAVATVIPATANLAGAGTLTVPAVQQAPATAAGLGAVTALVTERVIASPAGAGALSATSGGFVPGAGTLAGAGALTAAGTVFASGTATIAGAGTVTAPAVQGVTAALGAAGSITAAAVLAAPATVAGAGAVTASANAHPPNIPAASAATVTDPRDGTDTVTAAATGTSSVS